MPIDKDGGYCFVLKTEYLQVLGSLQLDLTFYLRHIYSRATALAKRIAKHEDLEQLFQQLVRTFNGSLAAKLRLIGKHTQGPKLCGT